MKCSDLGISLANPIIAALSLGSFLTAALSSIIRVADAPEFGEDEFPEKIERRSVLASPDCISKVSSHSPICILENSDVSSVSIGEPVYGPTILSISGVLFTLNCL